MKPEQIAAGINALITETAAFIKQERKSFDRAHVSDKGLNQLVSYVDIEAEKILVKGLTELVPEAGFITEENTSDAGRKIMNWIIDPLDGTTNFIHNVPVYSVSVALKGEDGLIAGSVYEIGRDELFTAWKGGGAYCNGERIYVSGENTLKNALMATGFPYYDFEQMDAYIHTLKSLMQNTHGLRRMGSAAVDLAYVAAGRFEGFFEYGLNAWDVAAGCLLIEEAGGKVSDFKGQNDYIFGKTILADNGFLHEKLLGLIKEKFI